MQRITFKNSTWDVVGNLFFPDGFDEKQKYAAIICMHPGSAVKEQAAGLYAARLAAAGFVCLAFDASFQGESGGEPRYKEDPAIRVEDIRCAIDYFETLPFVDGDRIGIMGVCAGGGYSANAALTEKRIKALATVAGVNIGRAYRERDPLQTLGEVSKERTAEAHGSAQKTIPWTPASAEEAKQMGIADADVLEAIEYFRTPRGEHPRANNQLLFSSVALMIGFDAFHLVETLLTQPLLVIVGGRVGSFGSYRDGYDLFNKAASNTKNIEVIEGAGHYDLYDRPEATGKALEKLIPFFTKYL